jgi:hypothetical protein
MANVLQGARRLEAINRQRPQTSGSRMTWTVRGLSARNLQWSRTDYDICPKVELLLHGVEQTLAGETETRMFHRVKTRDPQWNDVFQFPFFRCHTLEFRVVHYRPMIEDVPVGRCLLPMDGVEFGQPMTLPLMTEFQTPDVPTLTFQVDQNLEPFPNIPPNRRHRRLCLYLTYSPAIAEGRPVSFKCVAVDAIERRFVVLDDASNWMQIGKSGKYEFIGPTGRTQIALLDRHKLERSVCNLLICSGDYEGSVTLHFLLNEVDTFPDAHVRKLPKGESLGILHEISVAVGRDSIVSLPERLRVEGDNYVFEPIDPIEQSSENFETAIAYGIASGPLVRRVLANGNYSLPDMAAAFGVGPPTSVHVIFGWLPTGSKASDPALELSLLFFDPGGKYVGSYKRGILMWEESALDGRVKIEDGDAFKKRFGFSLKEEFFTDYLNFAVALDQLAGDIGSVAFVGWTTDRVVTFDRFRRKFLRFVDPATKIELALFPYQVPLVAPEEAVVIGGIVQTDGAWGFRPALKVVARGDDSKAISKWQELIRALPVPARPP